MTQEKPDHTQIQKPDYVRRRLQEIGFWFVDIPRTSSTAIRLALYRKHGKLFGKPSASQGIGIGLVPPHVPAQSMKDQLGPDTWDKLYTFTIVRNPFERVLSLFLFLQSNGKLTQLSFTEYVARLTTKEGFDYHGHTLGNTGYVCDQQGELLVDEVFRFEKRELAMPVIAEKTGCAELLTDAPKTYQTDYRHYSDYYDSRTRSRVESFFREDFERFGYSFEAIR